MRGLSSSERFWLRKELCAAADGRCQYCGVATGLRDGTVDHWLPQAMGGSNGRGNLRWCCWACNQAKGSLSPAEWEAVRPTVCPAVETAYERRCRLLSEIARKQREIRVSTYES